MLNSKSYQTHGLIRFSKFNHDCNFKITPIQPGTYATSTSIHTTSWGSPAEIAQP